MNEPVAILFARQDSIYKTLPGCDVFDIERDALNFRGGMPVVAHPPCRAWGRLRTFAKPRPGERELALNAVCQVRINGGVLEHPVASQLWPVANLPEPGNRDAWGGGTPCRCISTGGGIGRRKPRFFTSSAANRRPCRRYRFASTSRRTLSSHENALAIGRTSRNLNAKQRRCRWLNGWLKRHGAAQ